MNWTEMIEAQFDKSKVKDRKTREFIETAPDTMFPSLLPVVQPQQARSAAEPVTGEVTLFDLP